MSGTSQSNLLYPIVTTQAVSVSAFVNTLGVNTKMSWLNSSYFAPGINVLGELQYLGIHNVRDGANANIPALESLMAAGIKFDLGGETPLAPAIAELNTLEQADPGGIIAVEGVNESPVADLSTALADQQALYSAVKADPSLRGVQVYNYTIGSTQESVITSLNSVSSSSTTGNTHAYSGTLAPIDWYSWNVPAGLTDTPGLPYVVTETGYNTAAATVDGQTSQGVTQDVQAKYTLDTIFDMFKLGVQTTYIYELMDSFADPTDSVGELNFGLFNADGTPKLAAQALHNLTTILGDTGANASSFASGSLSYSVQGLDSNINPGQLESDFNDGFLLPSYVAANLPTYGNSLLLEKSNGSFDLAVWEEPEIWNLATSSEIAAPTTPVVITLATTAASVEVYDPLLGSNPIETFTNVTQITVGVSDHPVIIEIDPFRNLTLTPGAATISTSDSGSINLFAGLQIGDPNPSQTETATVSMNSVANGALTDPNARSDGSIVVNGVWEDTGSASSVTAALAGLMFSPTQHEVAPGQSVVTKVTANISDTAGQTASVSTLVTAIAAASPLTIVPKTISITVSDAAHSKLFTGVSITDPNAGQSESATVTLSSAANGTLTDPNAKTDGSSVVNGVWEDTGSASSVSAALASLVFTPTQHEVAAGQSVVTTVTAHVVDTAGQIGSTSTIVTAIAAGSPISVSEATNTVTSTDGMYAAPFAGMSITDPNAGQNETATVKLSSLAQGMLVDPNAGSDGSTVNGGSISFTGTAANVAAELGSLIYEPSAQLATSSSQTVITATVTIQDTVGQAASATTSIIAEPAPATPYATAKSIAAAMLPVPVSPTIVGSGPDTIGLTISEDAYQGNAQFVVLVNGAQVGGVQTATAQQGLGQSQIFDVEGSFSSGADAVSVVFTNDVFGSSPTSDRNLYVLGASYSTSSNPAAVSEAPGAENALLPDGPFNFKVNTALPGLTTIGSGPDQLQLTVAEQAYLGDAQFTVSVDGQQIGGVQTATAIASAGESQVFNVYGTFGAGDHDVSVTLVNPESSPGYALAERSLFVEGATLDGTSGFPAISNGSVDLTNGTAESFSVGHTGTAPIVLGSGPDTLALFMSEDYYLGNAQFTVSVDGQQIGGQQTATEIHGSGQAQEYDIQGNFTPGSSHTVSVDFLNDAAAQPYSPTEDRNLYVDTASINGNTIAGSQVSLLNTGSMGFSFTSSSTPAPVTVGGTGPDTLALNVSEDYYQGNAQFTVAVDGKQVGGVQTASAIHGNAQSQVFDLFGSFSGTHTVSVDFLNDAYGTPFAANLDRNLYVGGASVDGTSIANGSLTLLPAGAQSFTFTH